MSATSLCICKTSDIPDHFLGIDVPCLVNGSGVSPLRHIVYCVCKHQVNPPCYKQDPSQNVLDYAQDFMLHNAVLQVKNQLTNSAPKDFKCKLELYNLGRRLVVRKSWKKLQHYFLWRIITSLTLLALVV